MITRCRRVVTAFGIFAAMGVLTVVNSNACAQAATPAKKPATKKPAAAPPKITAEEAKVTAELTSNDESAIADAVNVMKEFSEAGKYANDFTNSWLPQLLKDKHYQDAADLALANGLSSPHTLEPMMEIRAQAFMSLDQMPNALQAAKSVYNLMPLKKTASGVQFFALCLSRAHPEDPSVASKFRDEQASATTGGPTTRSGASELNAVTLDPQPFADAIQTWSSQLKFADRVE